MIDAETKADCYSGRERAFMLFTQRLRALGFGPLLRALSAARVRPDHLTFLSLVAGLAFVPLYFWSLPVALFALALHVLLDGLDGPLARHLDTASRGGSFTDSMADQAVIAATTLTLMYTGMVGHLPGALYIVIYTVVVLFAMARNFLGAPYTWLFRPRFLVYIWIPVEAYWLPGTIDYVLWACVGLLSLKLLSGFVRIRKTI
jgi:phosphatidylglycerophosphate synthase